jgi:hypothetical protein
MLCYGQGALATSTYAPAPIRWLGAASLLAGGATLWLGPDWAILMMGVVFGLGHIGLGLALLLAERRARPALGDQPSALGEKPWSIVDSR